MVKKTIEVKKKKMNNKHPHMEFAWFNKTTKVVEKKWTTNILKSEFVMAYCQWKTYRISYYLLNLLSRFSINCAFLVDSNVEKNNEALTLIANSIDGLPDDVRQNIGALIWNYAQALRAELNWYILICGVITVASIIGYYFFWGGGGGNPPNPPNPGVSLRDRLRDPERGRPIIFPPNVSRYIPAGVQPRNIQERLLLSVHPDYRAMIAEKKLLAAFFTAVRSVLATGWLSPMAASSLSGFLYWLSTKEDLAHGEQIGRFLLDLYHLWQDSQHTGPDHYSVEWVRKYVIEPVRIAASDNSISSIESPSEAEIRYLERLLRLRNTNLRLKTGLDFLAWMSHNLALLGADNQIQAAIILQALRDGVLTHLVDLPATLFDD